MLPKKNRLNLKKETFFKRKNNLFYNGFLFGVSFLKENSQPSKFAFLVSKKIDKRATKRNRIKRLLAAAVREFLPQIKDGFKFVFLVKKEILDKDFWEIKKEVKNFLEKNNLLK